VRRAGESWAEWVGVLLLLAGVVAFVVTVIGLAVTLCRGGAPFPTQLSP
jgi:hypothetical protein